MSVSMSIGGVAAVFGKAFKAAEGETLALKAIAAFTDAEYPGSTFLVAPARVVIIDHPPTDGLLPLIEALEAAGSQVILRDHHGDNPRDAEKVGAIRAHLGERAVISTRAAHPACSTLIASGEFAEKNAGTLILADADQDGVTAALKAAGVTYPELDADAAVLDGPMSGKTKEALSPLGFLFVRAWGALPPFGDRARDGVFAEIVSAFAAAAGAKNGIAGLDGPPHDDSVEWGVFAQLEAAEARLGALAEEYERKVGVSKTLAERIETLAPGVRAVDVTAGVKPGTFDQPTLTGLLDRGAVVTVLTKSDGPIAKTFGTQVSLARTKDGETAGIDLAALVPTDWAKGPEAGVISNTPFLLHLSPARWEEFRPLLLAAIEK